MMRGNSNEIRQELISWFELFSENKVYMWSDVLAYDCVLFNDLFYSDNATAEYGLGLPKGICYIPFDIATLMKAKGVYYDISREEFAEVEDVVDFMETLQAHYTDVKTKHNALWDAIIIKKCYEKLMKLQEEIILSDWQWLQPISKEIFDKKKANYLATNAYREILKRYNWDVVSNQYIKLYNILVS